MNERILLEHLVKVIRDKDPTLYTPNQIANSLIDKLKEIKKNNQWDKKDPCPLCGFHVEKEKRLPPAPLYNDNDWD